MGRIYKIILDGTEHQAEVLPQEDGFQVSLDGVSHRMLPLLQEPPLYSFLIDGTEVLELDISFQQDQCQANFRNLPYRFEVYDPRRRRVSQSDSNENDGTIAAPMPGKVVEVKIAVGDEVKKGQAIVVLEAMKMQNELFAPLDGKVKEVRVKAGDTVESGAKLVLIEK